MVLAIGVWCMAFGVCGSGSGVQYQKTVLVIVRAEWGSSAAKSRVGSRIAIPSLQRVNPQPSALNLFCLKIVFGCRVGGCFRVSTWFCLSLV